jgi:hypothetical protein
MNHQNLALQDLGIVDGSLRNTKLGRNLISYLCAQPNATSFTQFTWRGGDTELIRVLYGYLRSKEIVASGAWWVDLVI